MREAVLFIVVVIIIADLSKNSKFLYTFVVFIIVVIVFITRGVESKQQPWIGFGLDWTCVIIMKQHFLNSYA